MKKRLIKCSTPYCRKRSEEKTCSTCRSRKCRKKDPERYAFNNLKANANRRGKEFALTLEQFRSFCIKTKYIAGKGRSADSFTIDRIENDKGYTIDNIQILTKSNNVKKFYLTYDWQSRTATVQKSSRVVNGGGVFLR